ncbi:hypothetical protein [Actinocatenispora thailandica]|nr:hypothetical protein [Actinocatenispora thailandica]
MTKPTRRWYHRSVPDGTNRFRFPGPWLSGLSLTVAPILLLAGTLLRLGVPFFFPDQLAAYGRHAALMNAAYATFLTGILSLWPGVLAVAQRVGATRPRWAACGAGLVLLGLFARSFHYGANTFAFGLVDSAGVAAATTAVAGYYARPEYVVSSLTGCIMAGWIVLAAGCYLSRTLGPARSAALALMAGLMIGVLKGSTVASVVETAGLAVAFVPLGLRTLAAAPRPRPAVVVALVPLAVVAVVLGQLG